MVHERPSTLPEPQPDSRPRVFLSPEEEASPRDRPSRLASWLGLLKYKGSLLTTAAHNELRAMAWVLLLICLFEVVVWTYFFNAVFNRDVTYWGRGTLGAFALACIFGLVVFFFERQMLTFDTKAVRSGWRRWWRIGSAGFFRLIYIGVTAWITANAFELRFFRPAILERAHHEAVRESVVKRWLEVNEAQEEAGAAVSGRDPRSVTAAAKATSAEQAERLAAADHALREAERERDRIAGDIAAAEVQQEVLRRAAGLSADAAAAERQIRTLDANIARLRVSEATANDRVTARQNERDDRERELGVATGHVGEVRQVAATRAAELATRLHTWAAELGKLEPGAGYALEDWTFESPKPDFLEQLRILSDLRQGGPPLWPGASEEAKAQVGKGYGLLEVPCLPQAPESTACREVEARKKAFRQGHWMSLLLSLLIPSLMVIIKLFMLPDELSMYYSRRHQARSGEPEARRLTAIDDFIRAEGSAEKRGA